MKYLFYIGLFGLALYEIAKVYFIMPMPGSQDMNSIDLAYFLHVHRWSFRAALIVMTLVGAVSAFKVKRKWLPAIAILPVLGIAYMFNFEMLADRMFREPEVVTFKNRQDGGMNDSTVVLAVAHNGVAKGYPLRYIVYHHQVRDTLAGKPIMVTYCSVCRTGRVFEPTVNGAPENFRLVGMDHFNAIFEDITTKSWWQQATGVAVTGDLKGAALPEVESFQMTAGRFFSLYPFGKIMQADVASVSKYDSLGRYEKGKSKSKLTGTDSLSWKDKSWVVGVKIQSDERAYDWNDLKRQEVINDVVGSTPILIALSEDGQSFAAFERSKDQTFSIKNDTLIAGTARYDLKGKGMDAVGDLKRINSYQEFWHSWKTFHPQTSVYQSPNAVVN